MLKMWRHAMMAVLLNSMLAVSADNVTATDSSPYVSHQVVSDIIPVAPKELLNVTYPDGVTVNLGNELTPLQVKNEPTVTWNATTGQYYTLIFIDADAPSRQNATDREMQHWVVGNIPASNVSAGDTIAQYVGAGPGQGSGLHRYVLLMYQQPSNLTFDEQRLNNTSAVGRAGFSTVDFAKKYNLSDPVAGNFFQAQYDSSVPKLYEQLGISINPSSASPVRPNKSSNLRSSITILFVLGLLYVR